MNFAKMRIRFTLPTMNLCSARGALAVGANEIKAMIDDGRIAWAWNVARAKAVRRELRILARCICDLQAAPVQTTEYSEQDVVNLLYGVRKPFICGNLFSFAWNCDSGHTITLLRDGSIKKVPGSACHQGRNGTPHITWSSAVAFLQERRLV